jgi:hypothetical protein
MGIMKQIAIEAMNDEWEDAPEPQELSNQLVVYVVLINGNPASCHTSSIGADFDIWLDRASEHYLPEQELQSATRNKYQVIQLSLNG